MFFRSLGPRKLKEDIEIDQFFYRMTDLTQLQAPAAVVIKVAAAKAGFTPAASLISHTGKANVSIEKFYVPVDLYSAPQIPPAAIPPHTSCLPLTESMVELTAL